MTITREISLAAGEELLVKHMPTPFRYARLVEVEETGIRYLLDLSVPIVYSGVEYVQVEMLFNQVLQYANYYTVTAISADGVRRGTRQVGRSFWGSRTVRGLLVWELEQAGDGYEIVDWGGFAVPDDAPAA